MCDQTKAEKIKVLLEKEGYEVIFKESRFQSGKEVGVIINCEPNNVQLVILASNFQQVISRIEEILKEKEFEIREHGLQTLLFVN